MSTLRKSLHRSLAQINELKINYIPDLCVKHNGEIWFVEFKNVKGQLIATSIIFELWNLYTQTYKL